MSALSFENEQSFVAAFSEELLDNLNINIEKLPANIKEKLNAFTEGTAKTNSLQALFKVLKSCFIIQMETDKDHVHICPKISVSDIVKQLKQYTTYQMWNCHKEYLSQQYWKHKILWSDGYFVCSIGQVSQEIIEKYIQNQG